MDLLEAQEVWNRKSYIGTILLNCSELERSIKVMHVFKALNVENGSRYTLGL